MLLNLSSQEHSIDPADSHPVVLNVVRFSFNTKPSLTKVTARGFAVGDSVGGGDVGFSDGDDVAAVGIGVGKLVVGTGVGTLTVGLEDLVGGFVGAFVGGVGSRSFHVHIL